MTKNDEALKSIVPLTPAPPSTNLPAVAPAHTTGVPMSVAQDAAAINRAHSRSALDIMETARLCSEARKRWKGKDMKTLYSQLSFDRSQFSRYCNLYESALRDLIEYLPPSQTTMDILRQLPFEVLNQLAKEGTVSPGLKRKKARELVASHPSAKKNVRSAPADSRLYPARAKVTSPSIAPVDGPISLEVDWNYEKHQSKEFRAWLDEGALKFGVIVLNPEVDPQLGSSSSSYVGEGAADDEEFE